MSEPDWDAERERLVRRSLAQAGLVFGPLVGLVLTFDAVSDHPVYVPGDPRNEPLYWIATAVVGVAAAIIIVTLSVGELRRGRRVIPVWGEADPGLRHRRAPIAMSDDEREVIRQRAAESRRQERRRDNARLLLVMGPCFTAVAIFSVFTGGGIYEPGDWRLEPAYVVGVIVAGVVLGTAMVLIGIREIRRSKEAP
jgi:hypothetical protein